MKTETWETRMQVTPYEGEDDYLFSDEQFLDKLMNVELVTNCGDFPSPPLSSTPDGFLVRMLKAFPEKLSRKTLTIGGGILAVLLVLAVSLAQMVSGRSSAPSTMKDVSAGESADSQRYNILRSDYLSNGYSLLGDEFVFDSNYYKNKISSITFLDTLDGCPDDAWDASEGEVGSVMAWVGPNGELFDLYIGAEGRDHTR